MFTKTEAMNFAYRISPSLKVMNSIGFADMSIKPPEINFYPDKEMYFDPNAYEIHIGVYGIVDLFHPKNETEFLAALNYVRGHEEQHVRSTASRPYAIAIQKGCETIIEYIQQKTDGYKRRFRNESAYIDYVNNELPSKGVYISWKMLREFIAGLANSLEDGRIERIRAGRRPGFEVLRTYHRGVFWKGSKHVYKPWEDIKDDSYEKLVIILNQILSLATCQLYEKGFAMAYVGTPIMDEVNSYMPAIGRAVFSQRTRGLIEPMREICKGLAPLLYDVCRMSHRDAMIRELLEKMIRGMIKAMLDREPNFELSEGNEDTESDEEHNMSSVFENSDLVIVLDDETYDKLEKRTKKGNKKGITVVREHPKEDSSKEKGKGGGPGNAGQGPGSGGGGAGCSNAESEGGGENKQRRSSGNGRNSQDESAFDSVKKEMEEAAKKAAAESKDEISRVNTSASSARRTGFKEMPDKDSVVSQKAVKDICPSFKEEKRKYKLDMPLPSVLAARGKTLHNRNSQYFKSLSTPNRSFLDSGSIDPSRIYGLAFGDTNVFRKAGVDKKFDGCAYILIDNSGSMSGKKRKEACKAAAVIEEGFKGLIPFKIVAFDDTGTIFHEVIKGWEEATKMNCCWNFCLHGRSGAGNEDGYDIKIATRELLARKEKNKMLIVLSDGEPGDTELCKRAIADARKAGIEVHGIYFEEGAYVNNATFAYMYEKDYVCCRLDEIDQNLYPIMKRFSRK